MKIEDWYSDNFESKIAGRYVTFNDINPLIDFYKSYFEITVIGESELGVAIPIFKIGSGKKKVLAWSQMHGNESTTTKAIFDFLKFLTKNDLFKSEIKDFYNNYTLYIIPMLNPDGAGLYTRNNANGIDLNRDAQNLSQKESRVLMNVFSKIKPDLCLNLHGQRTIFGLSNKKPASISFLSPASDKNRSITESRKIAMSLIVKMNHMLQKFIPGQVGRYDDSFNANCFGDYFQMKNAPVILFEAGHFGDDYQREFTRKLIFYSFLAIFDIVEKPQFNTYKHYLDIPENIKNYYDVIIRNVNPGEGRELFSIAIQFSEILENNIINFEPRIANIGDLKDYYGYKEIDLNDEEILVNYQNDYDLETNVLKIVNKNDNSLIYFDKNNFFL